MFCLTVLLHLMVAFVIMSQTVWAQTKTQVKRKPPVSIEKHISDYMRNVGLLYLETIDEMLRDSRESLDNDSSRYDRLFRSIDDRIEITIKSETDRDFWALLQTTKSLADTKITKANLEWMRDHSEETDYARPSRYFTLEQQRSLAHVQAESEFYIPCVVQARNIIRTSIFSEGECDWQEISAAGKAAEQAATKAPRGGKTRADP